MADDTIIQATDTTFERQGYTLQQKGYLLGGGIVAYLSGALGNHFVSSSLTSAVQSALYGLATQNTEVIPGGVTLFNIHSLSPTVFQGVGDLQAIWQRDPYSTEFEDDTQDLYERSFAVARAAAQSGPTNVRGGTVRQALELADLGTQFSINRFREVWQAQQEQAKVVVAAVDTHNRIETDRWRLQLNAQQLQAGSEQGKSQQVLAAAEQLGRLEETSLRTIAACAEFLGVPQMRVDESLRGVGFQGAHTTNFGMSYWK